MKSTWKPHERHGRLTRQSDLPESVFAFPRERKEPLTDARHVRNAVARFDQVIGVSEADRELAFANIKKAAKHYGVDLSETSWQDLGVHPQRNRKASSRKGAATRKRTGVAEAAARKGAATRKRLGIAKKAARKAAATRKRRKRG
jgi:arginyl-tRNA synthetase